MERDQRYVQHLIDFARAHVQKEYGTGKEDGNTPLAYHNLTHLDEVLTDCRAIASLVHRQQRLSVHQTNLCLIAAAFHDVVQRTGPQSDTNLSVQLFQAAVHQTKAQLTDTDIEGISNAILSTTFIQQDGIPTQVLRNNCIVCAIVADADLAGLAQPSRIYWERANRFEQELFGSKPTREQQIKMLQSSQLLLRHHHFFTPEANVLFPHQKQNLQEVENTLKKLESSS